MSGNPAWVKGVSGNPTGLSKAQSTAAMALARKIQAATNDGQDLLDFAVALKWCRPTALAKFGLSVDVVTVRDRQWAVDWLTDRGFGKALQSIDIASASEYGTDGELIVALLKTLSPSERAMYLADAAEKPEAP